MSFEAQQQTLFALLFDTALRERFCSDPAAALAGRGLDDAERDDFLRIPAAALRLDAQLRMDMVLAQLCASYPVAVTAVASGAGGQDLLRSLVTVELMRSAPVDRALQFGEGLRAAVAARTGDGPPEQGRAVMALLEAELGMARTGAALRRYVLETGFAPAADEDLPGDWEQRPASIAAHVSAVVIPGPYRELLAQLCPVPERALWRHLRDSLPAGAESGAVRQAIEAARPLLHVARAELERLSLCAPDVRHGTVELGAGFAALLPYLDGERSVAALLRELAGAGGDAASIDAARSGFRQLLESGMIVLC